MGEGNTPLIPGLRVGRKLGLRNLWFKLESTNPSGSYKDRFIAAELTHLLNRGIKGCLATSSGNTGASLAAYCARYQLPCVIVVNHHTPAGKLAQMKAHAATVIRVEGFAESSATTAAVFEILERLASRLHLALVVSAYRYCPAGMAGVECLGRELAAAPGGPPAHVFVPVGGGGLYSAVAQGLASAPARIHAVQPEGCSTVVAAFERGSREIQPVESTTRISGLAVPFDIDASRALALLRANGGQAFNVSDDEVFEAQRALLQLEGIYAEPAGAAAFAGLVKAAGRGMIATDEMTTCLVTGAGFKDPDAIAAVAAHSPDHFIPASGLENLIGEQLHLYPGPVTAPG